MAWSHFRTGLMEAVYPWARGSKFHQITEMSQMFDDSLIRAIRRLGEVLQQLILASQSIGETQIEAKLEEAMAKMDLNGDDEKVNIGTVFWSTLDLLSDDG